MASRKRKKNTKDLRCVFFPDDVENGVREAKGPASLSSSSSAKGWQNCGDSFVNTPGMKNLKSSGKKLSAIKTLWASDKNNEDPVHIAWSSSESGQSGDESPQQLPSRRVAQRVRGAWKTRRPTAPIQSRTQTTPVPDTDEDEPPVIDTDSDLTKSEEDVDENSAQLISDCDSECFDEAPEDQNLKSSDVNEPQISGFASDVGGVCNTMVLQSGVDTESTPLHTGEGSRRSVSEWVRSAHALLQTPQKAADVQAKTPDDSAKKKRKLQSGGLADRLKRLQSRQRSAVTFWRHQPVSDASAATSVDRPGVLALKVLEVQEECSMQLAHCEHCGTPGQGHQRGQPPSEESVRLLVLFSRDTAAQLSPASGDIIHVHPPWQSLSVEGYGCQIILNTHFTQKVCSESRPAGMAVARKLAPYSLCRTFGSLEVCRTMEENAAKQVAVPDASCGGLEVGTRHPSSLLEAIEGLGQAGCVGQDVYVVVQRVYAVPVPDCSATSILKARVPSTSSLAPPSAEKGKTRLCMLVQDDYGMFGEVQLHLLLCSDDLYHYCQAWQGKTCVLRGFKVVQRVTRDRRTRLFSLIDCLWPPVKPLKHHGGRASTDRSCPTGPAPSFCYLLSGQESSVKPSEAQTPSPLYLPPAERTLLDILQDDCKTTRCSFVATVLFKKMQSGDVGQGDVWLVLTDPSLQEESPQRPHRHTLPLCVSTSCPLTSSVLKALHSPAACRISFRDAIKDHGVFLCVEHSVVEVTTAEPPGPPCQPLPQPVRLDPLGQEITANSLCTLTGRIVAVDEKTAFSWPSCSLCGSDNLEILSQSPQKFLCACCKSVVNKPTTKVHLEVFLSCAAISDGTIRVKLQQTTVTSLLNVAALEANEFPGYDVESVLGKEVGPLTVYARVVTRKPALWIGLEEICL